MMTSDHGHCEFDHEALQTKILSHYHSTSQTRSARHLWRRIMLVLQAHKVLISIVHKTKAVSKIIDFETSSYSPLPNSDAIASESPPADQEICLDIQHISISENKDESFPNAPTITLEELSSIVNKEKNKAPLLQLGGIDGIAAALNVNQDHGVSSETVDLERRRAAYGLNIYCSTIHSSKRFFHFVFKATQDWTIFLLLCCAALSLGSGIKEDGIRNGWYDGTTIFIAVFILLAASAVSNYWRASKLYKLNQNTQKIGVLRDGQRENIPISDVVVGDIMFLDTGDRVAADGLFLGGDNFIILDDIDNSRSDRNDNPFLFAGAKVIEGSAYMLVTSVGMNTVLADVMSSVSHETRMQNMLKVRLDKINSNSQNIGLILAIIILLILLLRYLLGKQDDETGHPDLKSKRTGVGELMEALGRLITKPRGFSTTSVTTILALLLVGIQEGLPFMVTLFLSYWNKKVTTDQLIIQDLCATVTMGSITAICTDKTSQLILNQMEVDMLWVGDEAISGDTISVIPQEFLEALSDAVGTPLLACDTSSSILDDPLLPWAKLNLGMDMDVLKESRTVINAKDFFPEQQLSGLLMRKNGNTEKIIHLHWKGDAETILAMCCDYYDIGGIQKVMDKEKREVFAKIISDMASEGLQSLAFGYRPIQDDNDSNHYIPELHEDGLILLGLMGLKYPCRPEAKRAVNALLRAGVSIKLISTDELYLVKRIAIECGILRNYQDLEEAVVEGEIFRNLCNEERMRKVDQISVIARSLPSDKLLWARCLKEKGHVIAVAGDRTCDIPALLEADIGVLMGPQYSELARESSDLIILNDGLESLFTVMSTGRCAYANIRKFIQLELTMNISGLLITFVTTVRFGDSPISSIQLFCVNLMVGTLAAWALMTEPPSREVMEIPPIPQVESLVTKPMWRNIITQVLYQAVVLLAIQFKGEALPGMTHEAEKAVIFNGYVLCQIFNQFNARGLERKNVLKGIFGNSLFLVAVGLQILIQVVAVQFSTSYIGTPRLTWIQWIGCILIATISVPIDSVVKCIPGFAACPSTEINEPQMVFTGPIPSTTPTSQDELPVPNDEDTITP